MARIFILIILAWILYRIVKRLFAEVNQQKTTPKTEEKILQCCQCGCYVPEKETKLVNNKTICNNPACDKAN